MTTEVKPITIESVQANIDTARKSVETLTKAFNAMLASRGEGMSLDERLELPAQLSDATRLLAKYESDLVNVQRNARMVGVNALANPLHDVIRDAVVASGLLTAMADADLGTVVTFTVTAGADGNPPTINHKFSSAPKAAAVTDTASATGTRAGKVAYGPNAQSARDYLLSFGDAAVAAHVAKVDAKEVSYNDLTKRADALSTKLNHEKVSVA